MKPNIDKDKLKYQEYVLLKKKIEKEKENRLL
jgi:hypothetical protein